MKRRLLFLPVLLVGACTHPSPPRYAVSVGSHEIPYAEITIEARLILTSPRFFESLPANSEPVPGSSSMFFQLLTQDEMHHLCRRVSEDRSSSTITAPRATITDFDGATLRFTSQAGFVAANTSPRPINDAGHIRLRLLSTTSTDILVELSDLQLKADGGLHTIPNFPQQIRIPFDRALHLHIVRAHAAASRQPDSTASDTREISLLIRPSLARTTRSIEPFTLP